MYGYNPPRRPELRDVRVMVCESEITGYLKQYPWLSRDEVMRVMMESGPERRGVEHALARLAKVGCS